MYTYSAILVHLLCLNIFTQYISIFRAPWNTWSRVQSEGLGNPALGDPEVDQGPWPRLLHPVLSYRGTDGVQFHMAAPKSYVYMYSISTPASKVRRGQMTLYTAPESYVYMYSVSTPASKVWRGQTTSFTSIYSSIQASPQAWYLLKYYNYSRPGGMTLIPVKYKQIATVWLIGFPVKVIVTFFETEVRWISENSLKREDCYQCHFFCQILNYLLFFLFKRKHNFNII